LSKRYSISLFIMSHISSSLIWLFGQALLEFEVAGTQAMSSYGAHISGTSSSLVVHQSIPVPPFLFAPSFSQVYIYIYILLDATPFFFENCWSSSFHMASWLTLIWVQLAKSTSSSASRDNSHSGGRRGERFAPRFDGLRFIETLVTAHR
jgi:hypothetical protein